MNIFWHVGIVVVCYLLSLVIVDRLYIIQRERGREGWRGGVVGWLLDQWAAGVEYWRGRVSGGGGVGEKRGTGFDTQKGGSFEGASGGKASAGKRAIECLAGNAKGGGAMLTAFKFGNEPKNQSVFHGGISRARRRIPGSGECLQLKEAFIRQVLAGETEKSKSIFSIPI